MLDAHAVSWDTTARSTAPVDPLRLVPAVHALYAIAGLKPPQVAIAPSPLAMALAGGFAAGIRWARANRVRALRENLAQEHSRYKALSRHSAYVYGMYHDMRRFGMMESEASPSKKAKDEAFRGTWRRTMRQLTHEAASAATQDAVGRAAYERCGGIGNRIVYHAILEALRDFTRGGLQYLAPATLAALYAATHATAGTATDEGISDNPIGDDDGVDVGNAALKLALEYDIELRFMVRCARGWGDMYEASWMLDPDDSRIAAFRDAWGLVLPAHERYQAWEACALEGSCRMVHEEFCIISDRPEVLKVDAQNRPHCADGPSLRWRDGWSLYHWHGNRIPEDQAYVIHSPHLITVAAIESEHNAEIRRVMIDRYGSARYMHDIGAAVVHELPQDHPLVGLRGARLLRQDIPNREPLVYVDLLNSTPEPDGTFKRYLLRVDPQAYDGEAGRHCHAAAASTWRQADGRLTFARYTDYAPAAES